MRQRVGFFLVLLFNFFSISLFAAESESIPASKHYRGLGPFSLRIQNPIHLQHLALTPTSATSLAPGDLDVRVDAAYSSVFERGQKDFNVLDMDLEVLRTALAVDYGWRDGFQLGFELPFYRFDGGFLDGFLNGYHGAFGFPKSGRDQVPNNRYSYTFRDASGQRLNIPAQSFGVGDLTLRLKHAAWEETNYTPGIGWFFDFKVPTGDRGKGLGSGDPEFGLGVAFEKSGGRFHGYLNTAFFAAPGNELIESYVNDATFQSALAGEVSILDTFSFLVQFNLGTPLLKGTGIDPWDGVPFDIVIGFRGEERAVISKHDLLWQFAFTEDILSSGPSIDFTVYASIGVRFHTKRLTN